MENQFRAKNTSELKEQLTSVEKNTGEDFLSDNEKENSFFLSLEELKSRFPDKYEKYLSELRLGKNKLDLNESSEIKTYSQEEIKLIQKAISGDNTKLEQQLLEKIKSDETLKKYSLAIFFPGIQERIFINKEMPKVEVVVTGARGVQASKVEFPDKSLVVKVLENPEELIIAQRAAETRVGPIQFETLSGYITEEFVKGYKITEIPDRENTEKYMFFLGQKFYRAFKKIHDADVLINDQLLVDDFGKSHTIIDKDGEIRFIDFGAAVDLSNFPNISDIGIYNLMRCDPFARMVIENKQGSMLQEEINYFRDNFLAQFKTKEDVIKYFDYGLLNQGLAYLAHHTSNIDAFYKGIQDVA